MRTLIRAGLESYDPISTTDFLANPTSTGEKILALEDEIDISMQKIQKLLYWIEIYRIEGWLGPAEAAFLYMAAKRCSKGDIVELGSWHGLSTIFLSEGTKAGFKRTVFAIDPHANTSVHKQNEEEDTWRSFCLTCDIFHLWGNVQPVRQFSYEAAKEWEGPYRGAIGLLFIDADHEYESVKRDFEDWFPKIVEEGMVIFHDTNLPGVMRFYKEISPSFKKERRAVGNTIALEV